MGNVASAASGAKQPPEQPSANQSNANLPPAPPLTAPAPEVDRKPEPAVFNPRLNPGSYEEIFKKCKGEV